MGQEDRRIFYAIIGCGLAIFCLAVPALIVGAIALSQSQGGAAYAMYPMMPAPAATPVPAPGTSAPAPAPAPTPAPVAPGTGSGHVVEEALDPSHYAYDGAYGPAHWGEVNPAWSMCSKGTSQSPIDLMAADAQTLPADSDITPLTMAHFQDVGMYLPDTDKNTFKNRAFVSFNGHAITTSSPLASYFIHKTAWYQLLQFHFHTPSEHRFEGFASDAEIHMVHQTLAGSLAVIGIMVDEGPTSPPFIQDLFRALPSTSSGPQQFTLNITQMLTDIGVPASPTSFYTYAGSLTTPPCSEKVHWIVLRKKITMQAAHITALKNIMKSNARPVQPRNGRTVYAAT